MQIGSKLRRLRKLRGLTIEELADNSEITKGFISQLERDLAVPSVTTLKQILDVLGVEMSSFFTDISETERKLFSRGDRTVQTENNHFKIENLVPKMKYLEMEPLVLTIESHSKYVTEFDEDEGFGFIIRGKVQVEIENEKRIMERGDCFYIFFDNQLCIQNLASKSAEILMVYY